MKKIVFTTVLVGIMALFLFVLLAPHMASAADTVTVNTKSCWETVKNATGGSGLEAVITCYANRAITIIAAISSTISVLMIIASGFLYLTSGGNPTKVETANKALTGAIIGLIFVILSFAILMFVQNTVGGTLKFNPDGDIPVNTITPGPPLTNNGGTPTTPAVIPDSVKATANQNSITLQSPIDSAFCSDLKASFKDYYPLASQYGESEWTYYIKNISISSTPSIKASTVTVFYKKQENGEMYYDIWTRSIGYFNGYQRTNRRVTSPGGNSDDSCDLTQTNENSFPTG